MHDPDRTALEALIAADVQALSAESDKIGHDFASRHALTANDFRALLHVTVAENAGAALSAGELRTRMGTSGAAITYLVERMISSGHLLRESDPSDRRKVKLRVAAHGVEVARNFFTPLGDHLRTALADLPDDDLVAAHRVIGAVIEAMGAFRGALAARPSSGSGRLEAR